MLRDAYEAKSSILLFCFKNPFVYKIVNPSGLIVNQFFRSIKSEGG
jgi:hypothetical protein